jgi:hypothetical protein
VGRVEEEGGDGVWPTRVAVRHVPVRRFISEKKRRVWWLRTCPSHFRSRTDFNL